MGRLTLSIADYDGETSAVSYPASDLLEANIVDEYAAALTLQTETMKVSRGLLLVSEHTAKRSPQAVGKSTNAEAQREEKALVKYYDGTTFQRGTLEIPAVDMSKQHPNYPGKFYIKDVTGHHADWGTFVTAFQAFVPGPGGSATSVIEEIIHVGRTL